MKLILNNKEYDIPENTPITNNQITIVGETEESCLSLKSELTLDNLKSFVIEQAPGVTTTIGNKKYCNRYQSKKVSDSEWQVTYYITDVDALEASINETNNALTKLQANVDYMAMTMEVEL